MIGRSTLWNEEIRRTTEDTGTAENNSQIRRKGDPFDTPMTQKSGVRSIVPMGMAWKSAKFFWIAKECLHQQRRHLKIPVREIITERSPTEIIIW
jgi:hypothetical protein